MGETLRLQTQRALKVYSDQNIFMTLINLDQDRSHPYHESKRIICSHDKNNHSGTPRSN